MEGRFKRERTPVHLRPIHVDIWQKPTQYGKAMMPQSKIKFKKNHSLYGWEKWGQKTRRVNSKKASTVWV